MPLCQNNGTCTLTGSLSLAPTALPLPAEPESPGNGQGGSSQGWRGSKMLQTSSQMGAGAAGTALTPPRSFQSQAQAETHNIIIVINSNSMSAPVAAPRGCPHSCTGGSRLNVQPIPSPPVVPGTIPSCALLTADPSTCPCIRGAPTPSGRTKVTAFGRTRQSFSKHIPI